MTKNKITINSLKASQRHALYMIWYRNCQTEESKLDLKQYWNICSLVINSINNGLEVFESTHKIKNI